MDSVGDTRRGEHRLEIPTTEMLYHLVIRFYNIPSAKEERRVLSTQTLAPHDR